MRIRVLEARDKAAFCSLMDHAYPGFRADYRERIFAHRLAHDDAVLYGAFEGETPLGSYRRHRFEMNFRGRLIPVSGLGGVAVDMPQKKRHVCLEMVKDFHRESLSHGALLATLYPFKMAFYRRMGYGVCTRIRHFQLNVRDFPAGENRAEWIDEETWRAVFNRYARQRHGMIVRPSDDLELAHTLERPEQTYVGLRRNGVVTAGMKVAFGNFGAANPFSYGLDISEMLYDTPEELLALLAFIRAQEDQVEHVSVHTFDAAFAQALVDQHPPKEGENILDEFHTAETLGYGLMARVLDLKAFREVLAGLTYVGPDVEAVFEVADDLLPGGDVPLVIRQGVWKEQAPSADAPHIRLNVADFTAFMMGGVTLRELYGHARLQTTCPASLRALDATLAPEMPPECWKIF